MTDLNHLRRLERELVDKGQLIEAGWVGLRIAAIAPDAGKVQLEEMRNAFFAGAQHLFSSIMSIMDDGHEITQADVDRMGLISGELEGFYNDFCKRHGLHREH